MAKKKPQIYTVSRVNSLIKNALESSLPPRMTVSGEIGDWKVHSSGHCYFTLKDENSQLPAVMWSSKFRNVKFQPESGMAILATGYIDHYSPHGKVQLYVERLEPAGAGKLQAAFEQMVKRLKEQGLFDDEHKKPLPAFPVRIAVLTSSSGAALQDIADSIHSRLPCAKILLRAVPVQGDGAAEKIASALRDINRRKTAVKADLIIIGRGGGSMEDLWQFNEEVLARAVFDSKIPVISAVGHETDFTIADFVADARVSTPTKAGVLAVPDIADLLENLQHIQSRLKNAAESCLEYNAQRLETASASFVFKRPQSLIDHHRQMLEEAEQNMLAAARDFVPERAKLLENIKTVLETLRPERIIAKEKTLLSRAEHRIIVKMNETLSAKRLTLTNAAGRLEAMSPLAVLERGYSLTRKKTDGKIVLLSKDIKKGDEIVTQLAGRNFIESTVAQKYSKD